MLKNWVFNHVNNNSLLFGVCQFINNVVFQSSTYKVLNLILVLESLIIWKFIIKSSSLLDDDFARSPHTGRLSSTVVKRQYDPFMSCKYRSKAQNQSNIFRNGIISPSKTEWLTSFSKEKSEIVISRYFLYFPRTQELKLSDKIINICK